MFEPRSIRHCKACGAPTRYAIPADDNRERAVCSNCGTVHYENPINVVGTVPVWGDRVLLCRRNIEPRYGLWTLPAGFLEIGETTWAGALRETDEEAGARIELEGLFTVLNVVQRRRRCICSIARSCSTPTSRPAPRRSKRGSSRKPTCRGSSSRFAPCARH